MVQTDESKCEFHFIHFCALWIGGCMLCMANDCRETYCFELRLETGWMALSTRSFNSVSNVVFGDYIDDFILIGLVFLRCYKILEKTVFDSWNYTSIYFLCSQIWWILSQISTQEYLSYSAGNLEPKNKKQNFIAERTDYDQTVSESINLNKFIINVIIGDYIDRRNKYQTAVWFFLTKITEMLSFL
jgi:hypothetical protein